MWSLVLVDQQCPYTLGEVSQHVALHRHHQFIPEGIRKGRVAMSLKHVPRQVRGQRASLGESLAIGGEPGVVTVIGGDGSDLIRGGIGADVFVWNSGDRGAVDILEDFEVGTDRILLVGVTNAPGTGLAGKLEALDITDVTVEGQDAARLSYNGQDIYLLDVAASDLTLSDFEFI